MAALAQSRRASTRFGCPGVESTLAAQVARTDAATPLIHAALQRAFPTDFFRSHGLLPPTMKTFAALPGCLDYSSKLRAASPPPTTTDPSPLWQGERLWCALNLTWLAVNLHLTQHPHALLPRVTSVAFEIWGHRLVFHP